MDNWDTLFAAQRQVTRMGCTTGAGSRLSHAVSRSICMRCQVCLFMLLLPWREISWCTSYGTVEAGVMACFPVREGEYLTLPNIKNDEYLPYLPDLTYECQRHFRYCLARTADIGIGNGQHVDAHLPICPFSHLPPLLSWYRRAELSTDRASDVSSSSDPLRLPPSPPSLPSPPSSSSSYLLPPSTSRL